MWGELAPPTAPQGRLCHGRGMEFLTQQVVNGLTLGSVYALIALGYSMVYGILKLLNFAHGEVYMVGAFIGYGVLTVLGGAADPAIAVPLLIVAMFLAAMLGCGLLGVVIERFAYRPLRDAPRIAPLISALGVSFFLQSSALLLFTARFRSYDTPKLISFQTGLDVGPLRISLVRILVIVTAAAMMVALSLLVGRSRLGRAIRATAFDREAAAMMGVDVDRVIVATFFIGSALAGAGGVMFGLVFSNVYHLMGFTAGLKGFTAAVVGGIGSVPGAMLGGLLIGLAEAFAAGYVSSTFQDLIVFLILVAVMLVRPGWRLAVLVAAVAAVPVLGGSQFVIRIGINALLFALLALGLNVIVGEAGLLDLGYIAFYGFGAYGYALLSSNQFHLHWPSELTILLVTVATAGLGLLLGLPSRRLLGDYLAIVTLFFGQMFVQLTTNLDRFKPPWASKPLNITGGPNGIFGVDPMRIGPVHLISQEDYLYLLLGLLAVALVAIHRLVASRTGRAWRAARGRDRRRAERHPGAPAEAVRVRGRRRHRRPVRHRLRRRPAWRVPAEFRPDPADHDLRGGGARRRGEPAGRAAGRGRDQRAARGPPQSRQRAPAVLRCAAGAPARAGAAVVAAAGAARRDGGPRDRDPAGGRGAVAARGHRRRRRLGRARQGARRLRGAGRRGTGAHASAERRSCIGAAPGITCGDIGR